MMSREAMEWIWMVLICLVILLITACVMLEYHAERAKDRADHIQAALTEVLDILERAEIKTGVCCCGDSMDRHDLPFNCGHSPVDEFDYHGLPVLQNARRLLQSYEQQSNEEE